jgi:acetyl-CoA carboxylase carboxyltransferase component
VLRKAYGLGAQSMLGGHLKRPQFTLAWSTGEFGPMGVEGAVTLGFRRELEAIEDETERAERYQQLVDAMYKQGKAENVASYFEIDDVIDPADSRRWLAEAMRC